MKEFIIMKDNLNVIYVKRDLCKNAIYQIIWDLYIILLLGKKHDLIDDKSNDKIHIREKFHQYLVCN